MTEQDAPEQDTPVVEDDIILVNEQSHTAINDHSYSQTSSGGQNCNEQKNDINNLKYENQKFQESIKMKQDKGDGTSICKFIATDAEVRLNTGLPNKKFLNALYNHVAPKLRTMRYWAGTRRMANKKVSRIFKVSPKKFGPQRKLHGKTGFVIVLIKLRLWLSNDFLCDLLDISQGSCSQILNTWVRFLACFGQM